MERALLWGAGNGFENIWKIYGKGKMFDLSKWIIGIIDEDGKKKGCQIHGITVFGEDEIDNLEFDIIVITIRSREKEIVRNKLIKRGIDNNIIYTEDEIFRLKSGLIDGCKVYMDRSSVLNDIPKGGIIAEIGVAFGMFSRKLLDILQPQKMYAIDYFFADNPYLNGFGGMWNNKKFKESKKTLKEYYESNFVKEIEERNMEICQGLSWEVLEKFPDDYFDYIYLDAAHDYESVRRDITVIEKKIKSQGIVQFNDWGYVHAGMKEAFGVLPAVNAYISKNNHKIIGLCINDNGLNDLVIQFMK